MNTATSQALNTEFEHLVLWSAEFQKTAKKKGPEYDPLLWGGAGAGAALGAGELSSRVERISKSVDFMNPQRVTLYYTDPRRGAGHEAQGRAVKEALKRIGIEADLVNFDTEFGDKKALEHYNAVFNKFRADPKKSLSNRLAYMNAYFDFYDSIDKKSMKAAMSQEGILPVFANPQLAWAANKEGVYHGISMHTDQAPWKWMDPMTWKGGRQQRHIVTESAKKELFAQHPTIQSRARVVPDLAIRGMPDMSKKMTDSLTGKAIRMDGKFNITVSGGAQGWDTAQIARNLMKGNLPDGTVIHVVTGGNKQPNGTIAASSAFAEVQKLEAATAGKRIQVRAYGWSPLRQMMGIADMNVLRPHGTTITEATAAAKPFILAIPDSPLAMEANDARAASKYVRQPAVSMNQLGATAESVVNNYDVYHKAVKSRAQAAATSSDEWAKVIKSFGPSKAYPYANKPMAIATKALRFGAIPLAAVGAVGAFRTGQKHQQNKAGFYRTLPAGYKGKDPQGSPIVGKTWVRRRKAYEKIASIDILTGGMGAGKTTLADRLQGKYDLTVRTDVGEVVGGKYVSPPGAEKSRAIRQRMRQALAADASGKRVLLEGDPMGVLRFPALLDRADRVVHMDVGRIRRGYRVAKRARTRKSSVFQDMKQFRKELSEEASGLTRIRSRVGDRLKVVKPSRAETLLRAMVR